MRRFSWKPSLRNLYYSLHNVYLYVHVKIFIFKKPGILIENMFILFKSSCVFHKKFKIILNKNWCFENTLFFAVFVIFLSSLNSRYIWNISYKATINDISRHSLINYCRSEINLELNSTIAINSQFFITFLCKFSICIVQIYNTVGHKFTL